VVRAHRLAGASSPLPTQWWSLPLDRVESARLGRHVSLTTIGRKSGQQRCVIIGYVEDGRDLVALAMNGWDEGHPAWWLNLQATPDALVRLAGQPPRPLHAHAAAVEEHNRLWQRWSPWIRISTRMPLCGRPRRRWSFSNRATHDVGQVSSAASALGRCGCLPAAWSDASADSGMSAQEVPRGCDHRLPNLVLARSSTA
jgi:deazaflavin-dependent oxidoreductase (nitroreductase family)